MRKLFLLPITVFFLFSFFTTNAQVNDNLLAQELVTKNADSIGFSKNDLGNYIVNSSYFNETGGTQMVYLNQSYKGIPVYNQILVLAFKNGRLISKAGSFLANMDSLTNGAATTPVVAPAAAVRTSISDAKLNMPSMVVVINTLENGKKYNFGKLNIAAENITAELMWVPVDDGKNITAVKLAWQVELYLDKMPDYWNIRVDANTNTVVSKNNLTVFENFNQFNAGKLNTINLPAFMKSANTDHRKTFTKTNQISADYQKNLPLVLSPSLVGTANYTVIPYPAESPIHPGGTAAVRTNPWTLAGGNAVSLGWHNDGAVDYTNSRGNNVYAQEDRDNNNTTFGITANSTTTPDPLNFTYAGQPDYTVNPTTAGFQQFAITNLFYWNNLIHDLTYNYGFTEPAGNFQNNNQGRGGAGADYVIADAQDAGGLNNANMATPPDGSRPRMQMYLWDPVRSVTTMIVNTPPVIAGPYNAVEGAFSPANLLANVGPVTAQVVWYNDDAAGNTHYACNAPANSITGKIALISRGFGGAVCTATVPFTVKVKNAQDAGAVAVIMVNNVPGAPIVMGGGPDPTIIIPAVMISDVDGATIAAQLANNVNVTLSGTAAGTIQLDGDIDNGIIAHEYFHGVSNRLTGGGPGCLGNSEQAGEGWSDYMALMITTNWATATINDGFNIKRPIGNYAFGYPTTGPGIRTHPYSTNLTVNPLTYADLPTAVIPHGVGTVFCTALWEMTWQLIQTAGISANIFDASGTGGNVIAFKLMMEGLKLQPCSPGFLDARNAILQADVNLYGGAHTCAIWRAFAKRGMGFSAVQGSSNSNNDQTPAFNLPTSCLSPTVTINQAAAQPDPTSTSPINFTVVFDQPVIGFATGDVTLSGTAGATTGTVTGGPTTFNVAVSGMTASGTVIATIAAGVCTNAALEPNTASTSTDNTVNFILAINPNVTINQAAAQADPTSTSPINFTVVFDQVVTGFATGDVTLSGTAGATLGTVTGSGTTYNVAVSGMSVSGTVIATIPAGVCTNATLNPNNASTSTDNTVTYNFIVGCTSVNPVPNDTVCNGSIHPAINFTSPTPGTTFSWTNNNTSIGLAASGTGNIAAFTATNATTAPVTATVTVTPQLSPPITFTGSLLAGDLTMSPRLFRGAVSGTCAATQPFPGLSGTGPYFYDAHTVTNTTGSSRCVTVNLTTTDLVNANIQSAAYLGTFNPASLATNYIADPGLSTGTPAGPAGVTYSFNLADGATAVIIVFSTNVNSTSAGTANNYTLNAYGLSAVCTGNPRSFTITVNPTSTVNAIPNQVVCRGVATAPVNFTSPVANTVFNWTNNNTTIGLAASGTGNIASFIAQNPGTTPLVATVTVTPVYSPNGPGTPVVTTFNFTGAVQTFVVPAGITSVNIRAWGAQGNSNALSVVGGLGGYAEGNLAVTPGQTLFINTGGGATTSINGGFNGGGAAGTNAGCANARGGGGGGASDVRITANTLANRVLVAAGGGGAGGNRVAGCGRGTGGGGGGGLYGGGGGAGWPGVPPGGPVPTGGTQSAGGAGGVTTFTPGPTNGFPGVLGIGGAGGTEIGSAQGGSATAESGGVGGGLIGAPGNYNPTNNWCGHSGAGGSSYIGGVSSGITTPGLRSGNGQVQITYTPIVGLTCAGTPRTFTITVNPNPSLVIIADPGTTICQGDPTLLTVVTGTSTPVGTLYTQGVTPVNGSPSQVFEPANAAFTSQAADDFTVPAGATWSITQLSVAGIGAGVPTSVNVFFYANTAGNLPGAAIASYNNVATFTQAGGNYTVTLPSALNLTGGTYWVSFQVNMSFATSGQWFWGNFGAANIGNEYAWQNPGGGFATPCTSWGYGGTGCNVGGGPANRNNIFTLTGTSVVGGGPLPGGYTFLWSPAAGLSSTTSNPVAASPFITTLYTVNVSTAAGCLNSASILITVNQRPTVTTQPVSRTNCAGTSATFTVVGTGTALTYQWQVSTAGCAGPWVNLVNGAPYAGVNTATLTVNPVTTLMSGYAYRCVLSGVCAPVNNANISACAVLTVNPLPNVAITPVGPVCGGVACSFGTMLSVGSAPPPVPGSVTVNSGTINLPIPDNTANGVSNVIAMAGVPANATITNISVALNMPHTYPHDMVFNLRAPNGQILSLYKHHTNTTVFPPASIPTAGWYNAVVSQTATVQFGAVPTPFRYGQTAPAGPYGADALNGVTSPGYTIMDPTGFVSNATGFGALYTTPASTTGNWTLAMCDGGPADLGTLVSWSITIDYTTPGTGGGPVLTYVWSPLAGLYTDAAACIPYTGTNLATVYAAPTALTTYTVTATDVATGCINSSSVVVNYTPPAPTVTPNPVAMCLGDPAVRLTSSSSTTTTSSFTSGTISVPIPEGAFPTGPYNAGVSTIAVSGIPAAANVSMINVRMNITHAFVGDVIAVLQAPNGQRINLDAALSATNNPGVNFVNTVISSAGGPLLSSGTAPWTSTFRADAVGATFTIFGFTIPGGPIGYIPTTQTWGPLLTTGAIANGNWTLALYDAGAPDIGTLTNWSIDIVHVLGVPATPAVWTPNGVGSGLFNDAAATIPYTGTPRDTVWARPTPAGVYNYQATVQGLSVTGATIPLPPHVSPFTGNVRGYWFTAPSSFTMTSVEVPTSASTGTQNIAVLRFNGAVPPPAFPGTTNAFTTLFLTQNNPSAGPITVNIPINAGDVIGMLGVRSNINSYSGNPPNTTIINGTPVNLTRMGMQFPLATTAPQQIWQEAAFQISRVFFSYGVPVPGCTSPARTVVVTVNVPTTVTTQPVNQTICTDKVASFTVAAGGSGPFSYQWQVSTNTGNTWANVTNGGVYSGATTATLTITAPPVTMSGYYYRAVITGAAPCAAATSFQVILTVNPLPTIVITASPYTSLFPGLVTTLSSTVSPVAGSSFTWLRNGTAVPGAITGTLSVDVDGLGAYQLRVTDINGCTNISNTVTIKDSASGKCFLYPNPTSGKFQVRYHSAVNNSSLPRSLTVYDAKGDRVFTQMYTIGAPYDRMDVDMRAYGKGLYWVEIGDRNGNRLAMCRVVIQ